MVQTVNLSMFRDSFQRMGRGEQFSYEALELLFNYLEEYEESTGTPVELDVIALCCEYSEQTIAEIRENYSIEVGGDGNSDEEKEAVINYLNESTIILGQIGESILYQQF